MRLLSKPAPGRHFGKLSASLSLASARAEPVEGFFGGHDQTNPLCHVGRPEELFDKLTTSGRVCSPCPAGNGPHASPEHPYVRKADCA